MTSPRLSGLFIYPVKGCRGIARQEVEIDALGLVGDRRFMIVDAGGHFLSQRSHPQLARVATALDDLHLHLSRDGVAPLRVARVASPSPAAGLEVAVWSSQGLHAEDCGDEAAAWFSALAHQPVRLVRAGPGFDRPVRRAPQHRVGFADAYPALVLGEASLHDLNDRLVASGTEPVPLDRFRPNLVLTGSVAYAEDTWSNLRVGEVDFLCAGPCARCVVVTTDQATGERHAEPLRTLARYRRSPQDPSEVCFGQNLLLNTRHGRLRLGDPVTPS